MSNRAIAIVLFHCGSKSDSTFDRGGKATGISTAQCLVDFARVEDDKGWHPERDEINFIRKTETSRDT